MKEITIKISEMGEIEIEANGFNDASCLDSLVEMEKLFGNADKITLKPEARHRIKTNRKIKA